MSDPSIAPGSQGMSPEAAKINQPVRAETPLKLHAMAPDRYGTGTPIILSNDTSGEVAGISPLGEYSVVTDVGVGVKYDVNQDATLVVNVDQNTTVLAVADGMGGYKGGALASHALLQMIGANVTRGGHLAEALSLGSVAMESAHRNQIASGAEPALTEEMGATFVGVEISGNTATFINSGDSRAIVIREGEVIFKTRDHSFVQNLIDNKELSEEEAMLSPYRCVVNNAVQIIGGEARSVNMQIYAPLELKQGDLVVLGSDGLFDNLLNSRIAEICKNASSLDQIRADIRSAAREVVAERMELSRQNGESEKQISGWDDNFSLIVFRFGEIID